MMQFCNQIECVYICINEKVEKIFFFFFFLIYKLDQTKASDKNSLLSTSTKYSNLFEMFQDTFAYVYSDGDASCISTSFLCDSSELL